MDKTRSEQTEIVEVVEEEIYNSDVIDNLDEGQLTLDEVQQELGLDFKVTEKIGSGSYGDVFEAIYLPTQKKVAIKTMNGIFNDLVDCKRIL